MNVSKTIYFVRHGQSVGNTLPVYQPLDTPLTDKGIQQAHKIAERISKIEFDALIVSPLTRTRQTAEPIIAATGKVPEYSELFVERKKPRELEGREHSDAAAKTLGDEWYESMFTEGVRVQDGENFDDLVKRIDTTLEFLETHEAETIVAVSHGWYLRAVMTRILLGEDLTGKLLKKVMRATETENTGITVVQFINSRWRVWIYNDHAHLG